MGNGHSRPIDHPLGRVVQLDADSGTEDVAWEAYTLAVEEPGCPHIVEVDYPSDVPQTLGISLIEPNAAGALFPIGLDSGVDQPEAMLADNKPPEWLMHRIVFWPRTRSPIVLLTNRRDGSPAVYGKIRVRSLGKHLPRAFDRHGPTPGRLLGAYLDRPLFPENYNAEEAVGSLSDLGVDDWQTFYQGGSRLVAYLDHIGYGGLMIAALADGSTIYPSRLLEPTPRYDTGAFLTSGQDPVRKDVLEMLFRMFDRDRLQLVPALEFAAPAARTRGGAASRRPGKRRDPMDRPSGHLVDSDQSPPARIGAVLQHAASARSGGHAFGDPRTGPAICPSRVIFRDWRFSSRATATPNSRDPSGEWTT